MLPWIDMETSGLDPMSCCPLELAVLITTDDLEVVDHRTWLMKPTFAPESWPAVVQEMHTKNGLIKDATRYGRPIIEVAAEAAKYVREHDCKGRPACGSTVGFDRRFLLQWMPEVDAEFHYRSIDISSIKEAATLWAPTLRYPKTPDDQKAHRALADVYESVAEAKYYQGGIFYAAETFTLAVGEQR